MNKVQKFGGSMCSTFSAGHRRKKHNSDDYRFMLTSFANTVESHHTEYEILVTTNTHTLGA